MEPTIIELKGFPLKNQKAEEDPNALYDCVPTSIAACLEFLTGKAFTCAQLKDAVYGANYTGNQEIAQYVAFAASQGCKLTAASSASNKALIKIAQSEIALHHPVLFTEKDPYSTDPTETHVCAWFACGPGWLRAMDPMGGIIVTRTDEDWATNWLCMGCVWVMEKIANANANVTNPAPVQWSKEDKSEVLAALAIIRDAADHIISIIGKINY